MARTVENYLCSSVEDCKIDIPRETDLGLLRQLLVKCQQHGHQTKGKLVERRIKQLKKGATNV